MATTVAIAVIVSTAATLSHPVCDFHAILGIPGYGDATSPPTLPPRGKIIAIFFAPELSATSRIERI